MPRKINIPIRGGRGAPPPPAYGGLGDEGWSRGRTFLETVEEAGAHAEELNAAFGAVDVASESHTFFREYPRRVKVLALTSMDGVDSRVCVSQAEFLFTLGDLIWMRLFPAEQHPDLVQLFAPGLRPVFPLLVFFGDDKREFARWGPRPRALQELESATSRTRDRRDPEERRTEFYARSSGQDLATDLQLLLAPRLGTFV